MKDLLDRLQKAVEAMANPNPDTPEDTQELTLEGVVAYLTDQVEKAASDSPETKAARLAHVLEVITVAKNYEGPTPGSMRVPTFKDPAQITPSAPSQVATPQNASPTSNFGATDAPQPAGKPTTPAGGQVPPMTAGGSGFDSPATATFAKSMEDLQKAIGELVNPEANTANGGETQADNAPAETKAPEAPVQKNAGDQGVMWPLDLNTPFGRGETEDDSTPEWGFDHREAADRHAAERNQDAAE